jgi:outer membrane lipoprotein-sorting protein
MTATSFIAHLLALLSIVAPQTPPAKAQGDLFSDIYKRGIAKQRAMTSVRASFTETTVSTLLVKPLVAHGTLIAASSGRLRMTYTDPEPKILVTNGRALIVVWPERGEREQIDIRDIQKRIDKYFTSAGIDDLRRLFEIVAEPDASRRQAYHVELRPRRKQIKQGLERLELWIDRESDMLVQMRLSFPGGDQKTIALDAVTMNVPVAADAFEVGP